jgi:hypothetical protein
MLPPIHFSLAGEGNHYFLKNSYVFSSTKLEKRAEQIMPGSKEGGEEKDRTEGRGE